ncbi:MAG: hypothetical protein IPH16_14385 [Haliscomenobacter sp.]|nr:hypothetical protein [Haliscomenobacter sp.]
MITTSSTLDLLAQMRLHGMRHAYQTALASGTLESTSPDEILARAGPCRMGRTPKPAKSIPTQPGPLPTKRSP